jgi:hypothetical protein
MRRKSLKALVRTTEFAGKNREYREAVRASSCLCVIGILVPEIFSSRRAVAMCESQRAVGRPPLREDRGGTSSRPV